MITIIKKIEQITVLLPKGLREFSINMEEKVMVEKVIFLLCSVFSNSGILRGARHQKKNTAVISELHRR